MPKKRYKFNVRTGSYEIPKTPVRIRVYRVIRQLLVAFILASIVNLLFSFFFYTPKMYRINQDNTELVLQYNVLQNKIHAARTRLAEINHRDYQVYRSLFGTDTLDIPGVYVSYPESKYRYMERDLYSSLMIGTWHSLDGLGRLLYLESRSMDELELLARDKEKMAEAIPAIWPMDKRKLRGHIGAFGTRRNPVTGLWRPHTGIDLGGHVGEPIYTTADGLVIVDSGSGTGYGKQVLIDHGFGYRTRYAHLSKIDVAAGQRVKRGEKIGELGNTGRSSGPHLHYEVIYRKLPVDPLNYFSRDMSEEEFARIIESAQATTYEYEE